MAPSKRYAEGTTVTVQSSMGEITGILTKHGVMRQGWISEPEGDSLTFELAGHRFLFRIARPTAKELRERDGHAYTYPSNIDWDAKASAESPRHHQRSASPSMTSGCAPCGPLRPGDTESDGG